MSERTRCNYCTLALIEEIYGAGKVSVTRSTDPAMGDYAVNVVGVGLVANFEALGEGCEC